MDMCTKNLSGKIYAIIGPSGCGKTTLCSNAIRKYPNKFQKARTATTRERRDTETEQDYEFMSDKEFSEKKEAGYFVETAEYAGKQYGTPKHSLMEVLEAGKIALVPIDLNGALNYKKQMKEHVVLIFVHRDKNEVIKSIIERNIDVSEKSKRILQLEKEYLSINFCDHCIINNKDIDSAVECLNSL